MLRVFTVLVVSLCLFRDSSSRTVVSASSTHNDLRQVHIVAYHGASFPLKDQQPDVTTELTATGEKQMYDLGLWIKTRYSRHVHNKDPSFVRIESSSHNRAVSSANAIALGLFNATSRDLSNESQLPASIPRPNVPVYTSHSDKINDVTFRAHETCSTYQSSIQNLFTTNAVLMEMANKSKLKPILVKLSVSPAFQKYVDFASGLIMLKHLRDVVDTISVSKLECQNGVKHSCQQLPAVHLLLTDSDWIYLQNAAYEIELMKYSSDIAGSNIGGFLLHTIIDRMLLAYQMIDDQTHTYIYSTVDATLWGIMTALGEQQKWFESSGITGTILPHGSALILELHGKEKDPAHLTVDLHFKPGNTDKATLIGTICGGGQTKDHCPLVSVTDFVDLNVTKAKWCEECQNDSAEICVREKLEETLSSMSLANHKATSLSSPITSPVCTESMSTAGSMILGIVIGLFVSSAGYCYYSCRRTKSKDSPRHRTATTSARANTSNQRTFDTDDEEDNIIT